MHPTADTIVLKSLPRGCAAGDAAAGLCVTTLMGEIIDFEKLTDGEKTELLKIYRLWAKHRE
jgi:hypothetical protein